MSNKEYFDRKWDEMFERFKHHTETTGSQACPPRVDQELNRWIDNQRMLIKTFCIRPDRREKLEEFGFYVDEKDLVFDAIFDQLVIYKDNHGHLNVPTSYLDQNYLGPAVQRLRNKYKRNQLKPEWISRLMSIGFGFTHADSYWETRWKEISYLINEKGKLNTSDEKLKAWYRNQIGRYRTGRLDDTKMDMVRATLEEKGLDRLESFSCIF